MSTFISRSLQLQSQEQERASTLTGSRSSGRNAAAPRRALARRCFAPRRRRAIRCPDGSDRSGQLGFGSLLHGHCGGVLGSIYQEGAEEWQLHQLRRDEPRPGAVLHPRRLLLQLPAGRAGEPLLQRLLLHHQVQRLAAAELIKAPLVQFHS